MTDTGLVLEGGGMRGLYTAGVLEYFMSRELYFPYVIGVSAGACMGCILPGQAAWFGMDFIFDSPLLPIMMRTQA